MARKAPGKGERRPGPRGRALPEPLRWIRNAGLVVAWAVAVLCGWQAGGALGGSQSPGARADLLSAVLHGAAAWLGLTVIWLAGISGCQRIMYGSGGQAFRHSGLPEDRPNTQVPDHPDA